jgi:hypothetical protein
VPKQLLGKAVPKQLLGKAVPKQLSFRKSRAKNSF